MAASHAKDLDLSCEVQVRLLTVDRDQCGQFNIGEARSMERRLSSGTFYGETRKQQHYKIVGLTLSETGYAPRLRLPRHSHEHAYFCLVLRGAYTETSNGRERLCSSLSLILHPPDEAHSDQFHDVGAHVFNVSLAPHWLERLREHAPVLGHTADFHGGTTARLAMRLYREFQRPDDVTPLAIEGLVLEILAETGRRTPSTRFAVAPDWLRRVRDFLHAQFSERLSLRDVAAVAGVHPLHLARTFRRHYRCSVGEYVRRLRVEFACLTLTASTDSLVDVALAAGFRDQSHFCKAFKQQIGLTPSQFHKTTSQR
jgi:AraC family transcriptional regulator